MERLREYAKVDISDTKVLYLRYYEQFFRIKMIISGNVLHASTTIHDVIISDVIWVATQRWVVHNQKCILRRMAYKLSLSRLDFYINCFTELFEITRSSTSYIMKYYFTYPGVPICLKAIKLSSRKKISVLCLRLKLRCTLYIFNSKITRLRENNEVQINATFSQSGYEYHEDLKSFN